MSEQIGNTEDTFSRHVTHIFFLNRELVRQKAVMCLYRFQLLAPDLLAHVQPDLEQMIFDKDPGVMAAALNIVYDDIQVGLQFLALVFL